MQISQSSSLKSAEGRGGWRKTASPEETVTTRLVFLTRYCASYYTVAVHIYTTREHEIQDETLHFRYKFSDSEKLVNI